jgi:hypothetical protein
MPIRVGFVVDQVALVQVSLRVLGFFSATFITPVLPNRVSFSYHDAVSDTAVNFSTCDLRVRYP